MKVEKIETPLPTKEPVPQPAAEPIPEPPKPCQPIKDKKLDYFA